MYLPTRPKPCPKQVAEAAEKEAMENNWMVSIAVVNEAGHLMYFTKMDNTTNASGDIAIAKARLATYYRRDTKFHQDLLTKGNYVLLTLTHSLPIEGGVQLIYKNQVLGASG